MKRVIAVAVLIFLSLWPKTIAESRTQGVYEFRVPHVSTLNVKTLEPEVCVASWYGGDEVLNDYTASGEFFDAKDLTVASWDYPFGTMLEVTGNSNTVVVRVNDRGPARRLGRCLDLSRAAFEQLSSLDDGLINVTYKVLEK